jgi:hypothetical protein
VQLPIEPNEAQFAAIIAAVHDDRIERYLPAAQGAREDAFRLYLWNCALCESFYLPLHFAEVAVRNAIHGRLMDRIGDQWFDNVLIRNTLGERQSADLGELVRTEQQRHGNGMTAHHLVSELSFGFWQHMLTKRFARILGPRGMTDAFPNLPNELGRQEIHDRVETIRKWRNRIAHHKPIFDQGPSKKHQEALQLIRWVCHDVADWVTAAAKVTAAIDLRPVGH